MEQLLEKHMAGQSTRELADEYGVSHQTIAVQLRELKREHVTQVAGMLMVAAKRGEVLWLAIQSKAGRDVAPWLRYVAWVVEELEELTFRVSVSVEQKPDGIALGLEDKSPIGG